MSVGVGVGSPSGQICTGEITSEMQDLVGVSMGVGVGSPSWQICTGEIPYTH